MDYQGLGVGLLDRILAGTDSYFRRMLLNIMLRGTRLVMYIILYVVDM